MSTRKNKKRVKVEWVDKGKPADLTIKKGEEKETTYIVRVTTDNNRPIRADKAWISRQRRKGLINYSRASVESKRNGITHINFSYRTNKIYENEEEVFAKVRIKVEGHLDGLSEYLPYKEIILPAEL